MRNIKGKKGSEPSVDTRKHGISTLISNSVARIVDVISEGEIEGFATGDSGADVLINTIPLSSFEGIDVYLKEGAVSQEHIPGSSAESEYTVSTELEYDTPVTKNITNTNVDEVLVTVRIPALIYQTKSGKTKPSGVEFSIKINSTLVDTKNIFGICTSEYLKSYRLPPLSDYGSGPWEIELERITIASNSTRLTNNIHWSSYTELINEKIPYLDTAIVGFVADAQQFGGKLPTRLYHIKGIKVKYPSNYNPETRVYTGTWNGTFTVGYTNNPAWIYYDLLYSERYGCGFEKDAGDGDHYIDKWELYTIAQNCDVMVDDGNGGTEPRFTFNSVISKRSQALSVLSSLASTFRAKPFWYTGLASLSQDRVKDPVKVVCNADVVGGMFQYTGSSLDERATCINVSWNDPGDFYKLAVEVIEDQEGITRYGYNTKDIAAYGCTSRAQAIRYGKWYLYTELKQTTTVTYSASFDHFQLIPGDVIIVNDDHYITKKLGGRIKSATISQIILDRKITIEAGKTYTIVTENSTGEIVRTDILNSAGATDTLSITTINAEDVPQNWAVFSINSDSFDEMQFQIIDLTFKEKNIVSVKALLYDENKFAAVDSGIYFDDKHYSDVGEGALSPPTNLDVEEYSYDNGQNNLFGALFSWSHPDDARVNRYEIQSKEEDGDWFFSGITEHNSYNIKPIVGDNYYFRVRSVSLSSFSVWVSTSLTIIYADSDALSPITDLKTIDGDGGGSDEFAGKNCEIVWEYEFEDRFKEFVIEIYNGTTLKRTAATTEQSFIYTYGMNEEDNVSAIRSMNFIVYVRDVYNKLSTGVSLTATNPAPSMAGTIPTLTGLFNCVKIYWGNITPADNDLKMFGIYLDKDNPPTTLIAVVGANTSSIIEAGLDAGDIYYCQVEPWDWFGVGTKSAVANGEVAYLPADSIDMELSSTINISDSEENTEETLSKLYDNNKISNGIAYTLSGTDKWIEYKFPVEYIMDNVTLWLADAEANIYVAYKREETDDWSYLKAENDHTLDDEFRLLDAVDQSDASTNYLNAESGVQRALFPQALVAKYCRLYFTGSYTTTIYELRFTRQVIAEQIVAENLSSISANVGVLSAGIIQSPNYSNDKGILIDLDADKIICGGNTNKKIDWDGPNDILKIKAVVEFQSSTTGYNQINDSPNNLSDINSTEGTKLGGIVDGADVTAEGTAAFIAEQGVLATENNLDGVPDGTSWGRVSKTAISGGKIVLTSSGVTGTLPTTLSVAKCPDALADQTSANGQNLGWLVGSSGELTISANGKLKLNTSSALEITASGSVKVLAGADINMYSTTYNPSNLNFYGSTGALIGRMCSTDLNHMAILPDITPQSLSMGNSSSPWRYIFMTAGGTGGGQISLDARTSSNDWSSIDCSSDTNNSYLKFQVYKASTLKAVKFEGTSVYPEHSGINLGKAGYEWETLRIEKEIYTACGGGAFGIQIGDDSRLLDINIANTMGCYGKQSGSWGYIKTYITEPSSEKFKKNISSLTGEKKNTILDEINSLTFKLFHRNDEKNNIEKHLGIIAEDCPPRLAARENCKDDIKPSGISLSDYVSYALFAGKEALAKIAQIEKRLETIEMQ